MLKIFSFQIFKDFILQRFYKIKPQTSIDQKIASQDTNFSTYLASSVQERA